MKCTSSGEAGLTKTCADSEACASVSDGAFCVPKDCKCSFDGTSCGEIFPLSCRLPATNLYTCKKGEAPVELKSCSPGSCVATKAFHAAAFFKETANDVCIGECSCGAKGHVSIPEGQWEINR